MNESPYFIAKVIKKVFINWQLFIFQISPPSKKMSEMKMQILANIFVDLLP